MECVVASCFYPTTAFLLLDFSRREHLAPALSHWHGVCGHSGHVADGGTSGGLCSLFSMGGEWVHELGHFVEPLRFNTLRAPHDQII